MKGFELSIKILRISLGIIFLWFGLLKFSSHSPVLEIINASFPLFGSGAGRYILASFEVLIGLGLMLHILPRTACIILIAHMFCTFYVFILAPSMMFDPGFPFLTLEGEFVLKNLVLIAAGLVVLERHKYTNA
jgi:uncharacterized membrane protein YkgB